MQKETNAICFVYEGKILLVVKYDATLTYHFA